MAFFKTVIFNLLRDTRHFKKGHHSSKVVTRLTLPNSAKPRNFILHNPALIFLLPEAWGGHSCRSHAGHALPPDRPLVFFLSLTLTQLHLLLTRVLCGGTGQMGLPLREDGEQLNWPPRPTSPPPPSSPQELCSKQALWRAWQTGSE